MITKEDLSDFPADLQTDDIAQAVARAAANETGPGTQKRLSVISRRLDTVAPEKIDWLWPNKIPRSNLSIFGGIGGCGKSSVCIDMIARYTTGSPFPGCMEYQEPGIVAIVNCEDDAATVQRPRLDAAGADCSKVHLIDSLEGGVWIDFSSYCDPIERFIIEKAVTLLIIDPISGHIGGKKQNDTGEVRMVLQQLQAMATRTKCTIIAVTHSPKSAANAQSAFIGSQAFVSCSRAAFAFVRDRTDPDRRIMVSAKANYSEDESGLAFKLENIDGVGRVIWEPSPVFDHPDSFFGDVRTPFCRVNAVDEAAAQLDAYLSVARTANEVEEWAKSSNISIRTLQRAKKQNGHESIKRDGIWYWLPRG